MAYPCAMAIAGVTICVGASEGAPGTPLTDAALLVDPDQERRIAALRGGRLKACNQRAWARGSKVLGKENDAADLTGADTCEERRGRNAPGQARRETISVPPSEAGVPGGRPNCREPDRRRAHLAARGRGKTNREEHGGCDEATRGHYPRTARAREVSGFIWLLLLRRWSRMTAQPGRARRRGGSPVRARVHRRRPRPRGPRRRLGPGCGRYASSLARCRRAPSGIAVIDGPDPEGSRPTPAPSIAEFGIFISPSSTRTVT